MNAQARERWHLRQAEAARLAGDEAAGQRHMEAVWKARDDLAATYDPLPEWAAFWRAKGTPS